MYKGYTKTELKKLKASEILQGAIEDIQGGYWVCNELQQVKCDAPNHKMMGCAVGLVSLNAGDTEKVKIEASNYAYLFEDEWDGEIENTNIEVEKLRSDNVSASCSLVGVSKEILDSYVEVAVYTGKKSPTGAKRAIECLYYSIPDKFREEMKNRHWNDGVPLNEMRNSVVEYNDSPLTPKQAEKWFKQAQELAVKKGW